MHSNRHREWNGVVTIQIFVYFPGKNPSTNRYMIRMAWPERMKTKPLYFALKYSIIFISYSNRIHFMVYLCLSMCMPVLLGICHNGIIFVRLY